MASSTLLTTSLTDRPSSRFGLVVLSTKRALALVVLLRAPAVVVRAPVLGQAALHHPFLPQTIGFIAAVPRHLEAANSITDALAGTPRSCQALTRAHVCCSEPSQGSKGTSGLAASSGVETWAHPSHYRGCCQTSCAEGEGQGARPSSRLRELRWHSRPC